MSKNRNPLVGKHPLMGTLGIVLGSLFITLMLLFIGGMMGKAFYYATH